jgi:hypothetical protein
MFTILHNDLLAKSRFLLDSVIAAWQHLDPRKWRLFRFFLASFSGVYILPQIKPETARSDRVNCIISILSSPSIHAKRFSFYS